MKHFLLILVLGLNSAFSPVEESIVVIVNSQNSISQLTIGEVRSYWMRRPKKRWEAIDRSIKPTDRKDKCDAKRLFYSSLIKMSEEAVESYFSAKQYQSGEAPPVKFSSDNDVIEFVENEVGAIGYVSQSSLKGRDLNKIKVVLSL